MFLPYRNNFDRLCISIFFFKGDGIKSDSLTEGSYKPVTTIEIGEGQTDELVNWILTVVGPAIGAACLPFAWGLKATMLFSHGGLFKTYVATV